MTPSRPSERLHAESELWGAPCLPSPCPFRPASLEGLRSLPGATGLKRAPGWARSTLVPVGVS